MQPHGSKQMSEKKYATNHRKELRAMRSWGGDKTGRCPTKGKGSILADQKGRKNWKTGLKSSRKTEGFLNGPGCNRQRKKGEKKIGKGK